LPRVLRSRCDALSRERPSFMLAKTETALNRFNCCAKWVILALSLALLGGGTFSVEKIRGGQTALNLTRYDWWGMRKTGEISIPRTEIKNVIIDSQISGGGCSTYTVTIQTETSSTKLDARGTSMRWAVKMKRRILHDSCRCNFSALGFHNGVAIPAGIVFFVIFLGIQLRILTLGN